MDRTRRTMVLLAAALLIGGCFPAAAQEVAGEFRGTVVLRSGETLTGVIKLAEFGVVLGSGVGSLRQEYGSLRLTTAEGDVTIPARDIKIVDADWANQGSEDQPKWVIERITVTRNDGSKIEGTPTWLLHCSTASVELENRQTKRVHAFPLAQKDFTPDSFIKRIVIGELPAEAPAAPAEAPAAPAEAPAAPAEAPAAPAEAPAAPAEAPAAPAEAPAAPAEAAAAPAEAPAAPAEAPAAPAEAPAAPAEAPAAPAEAPAAPAEAPAAPAEAPAAPAEAPAAPAEAPAAPAEAPAAPAEAPAAPAEAPAAPAEAPAAPAEAPAAPAEAPAAPAEAPAAPAEAPAAPAEAPAAPAEAPAAPAEAPAAPAEAPAAPAEAPAAPAEPAFPPVPVTCSFSFTNLGASDLERAKAILTSASVGGSVEVSTAEDGVVTLIFVLPDITAVPKVVNDLRYKTATDGTQTIVFEEEGRQVSSSFRTARITGSVKINVTFMIAPGASLFYSPAPGEETAVPAESIDETGKVTLEASIARGQEFVYGRTVLGEIERCIKIDIFTGEVAEISKAAYQAHQ